MILFKDGLVSSRFFDFLGNLGNVHLSSRLLTEELRLF